MTENCNPSIQYLTLKELLDKDESDPQVVKAKGKIEYSLLKYVYILSCYEYARKDKRLQDAADLLITKRDIRGRWSIDKPYSNWEGFEFGEKGRPSKWATVIALRAIKKICT